MKTLSESVRQDYKGLHESLSTIDLIDLLGFKIDELEGIVRHLDKPINFLIDNSSFYQDAYRTLNFLRREIENLKHNVEFENEKYN